MNKGIYLLVPLALLIGTADASEYAGPIGAEGLRFSTGTSPARVSVSVANVVTPCATKNWYAYESAASGLAGLWTTALIQARIHDRTVKIVGTCTTSTPPPTPTGCCDSFGIEGILFIDLK